jgi:hypothetical protein
MTVCNHQRADNAGDRVHPKPPKRSCQTKADDSQHRDCRIRYHVDVRGPDVVVTSGCVMCVVVALMLFEFDFVLAIRQSNDSFECVRLRNLLSADCSCPANLKQ